MQNLAVIVAVDEGGSWRVSSYMDAPYRSIKAADRLWRSSSSSKARWSLLSRVWCFAVHLLWILFQFILSHSSVCLTSIHSRAIPLRKLKGMQSLCCFGFVYIVYYIISIYTTHTLPWPDFHLQRGDIPLKVTGQVVVRPNDVFAAQLIRSGHIFSNSTTVAYERCRCNTNKLQDSLFTDHHEIIATAFLLHGQAWKRRGWWWEWRAWWQRSCKLICLILLLDYDILHLSHSHSICNIIFNTPHMWTDQYVPVDAYEYHKEEESIGLCIRIQWHLTLDVLVRMFCFVVFAISTYIPYLHDLLLFNINISIHHIFEIYNYHFKQRLWKKYSNQLIRRCYLHWYVYVCSLLFNFVSSLPFFHSQIYIILYYPCKRWTYNTDQLVMAQWHGSWVMKLMYFTLCTKFAIIYFSNM